MSTNKAHDPSTATPTTPMRPVAVRPQHLPHPRPTLRTALRDLERSLFEAFEAAKR